MLRLLGRVALLVVLIVVVLIPWRTHDEPGIKHQHPELVCSMCTKTP